MGDFAKYALLKALAGDDLRLGVHWYLNADEEANSDGRLTEYSDLRHCDEPLYLALQHLVKSGRRSVAAVEQAGILPPNTIYFSRPLSSRDRRERAERRAAWNAEAFETLAPAQLVFMDPDNGLTEKPAEKLGARGAKYVCAEEIAPYYRRGQSLVIYQHQTREKGGLRVLIERRVELLRSLECEHVWAFKFRRKRARAFLIIAVPAHLETLRERTFEFRQTPWCRDKRFELLWPD